MQILTLVKTIGSERYTKYGCAKSNMKLEILKNNWCQGLKQTIVKIKAQLQRIREEITS